MNDQKRGCNDVCVCTEDQIFFTFTAFCLNRKFPIDWDSMHQILSYTIVHDGLLVGCPRHANMDQVTILF